jgi:hypothetical protein
MDLRNAQLICKQYAQALRAEMRTLESRAAAADVFIEAVDAIEGQSKIVEQAESRVAQASEQLTNLQNQIPILAAERKKEQTLIAEARAERQDIRDEIAGLQDTLAEAQSIIATAEEKRRILEQL